MVDHYNISVNSCSVPASAISGNICINSPLSNIEQSSLTIIGKNPKIVTDKHVIHIDELAGALELFKTQWNLPLPNVELINKYPVLQDSWQNVVAAVQAYIVTERLIASGEKHDSR